MCKYFHSFVLLVASVSSFFAHFLLKNAGMLHTWLGNVLNGQTFVSSFNQTELVVPTFDATQTATVTQVADFNMQFAQSFPTYYSFVAGGMNKAFLFLGVFFAVVFIFHVGCMFKCCGKECKK